MRFAPTLAAAALAAAGLTFIPSSADAVIAPTPAALTDAIDWLSSWSDEDGLLPGYGGEPSISATADAAKSLDEIGSDGATEVAGYVATAAAAKLTEASRASQEIAQGVWASDLAGTLDQDLADDLTAHVSDGTETVDVPKTTYGPPPTYTPSTIYVPTAAAPSANGRLLDQKFSAWTGTNAQAWAVLALAQAESSRAADALDYLLGQQCADGGFRAKFSDIDADGQTCAADVESEDTDLTFSSPDATATTVILLSELPDPSEAVTDAIADAVAFLSESQGEDGSYSEWYGVSGNSTGLAARALRLTSHSDLGAISAGWLRRHQSSDFAACASPFTDDHGAVVYSDDDFEAAWEEGLDSAAVGSAVAVTAQSLAALSLLPVTNPAPKVTIAPTTAKPGAKVAVTLTGANPDDHVCVAVNGRGTLLPAGTTAATVVAPRGVAQAPVTVQTASGASSTATLTVNTATKLKVTAAKKVKRGKKLTVTVQGLWPAETVKVKLGGITLGKAKANAAGKVVVRVKVNKSTVVGKKKLTVTGAFANRSGVTTVKVTR